MIVKNGLVFQDDGYFENTDVYIDNGRFAVCGGGEVLDAEGLYVIPGLVDIHFHGCNGSDFSDGTMEGLKRMAEYQLKNGVTAICPAVMTLPVSALERAMETAAAYTWDKGAFLAGINLEGPFISGEKAGAQNREYLREPDLELFDHLQQKAKGRIKLVSVAPELPGAMEFMEKAGKDVRISLAHTGADYDTALQAFDKGARHVTHLYNAMEPFSHRAPGLIGAACDSSDVMVELIADGVHIHPAAVRSTIKMFGEDRVVFISDSMRACGLSDGEYTLGGQPVTVRGNRAFITGTETIAGSVTNLMDCVRKAVQNMEIPLGTAVKCASVNPAKAVGIYDTRGSLQIGKIADAVLLDKDLTIRYIIQKGELIGCE